MIFSQLPFRFKQSRIERLEAFEPVAIIYGKGIPSLAAILKDISPNGARITLLQAAELPAQVEIEFQLLALSVHARIRWHHDNDIGVKFEEPLDLDRMPLRRHRNRADVVALYFKSNRAGAKRYR